MGPAFFHFNGSYFLFFISFYFLSFFLMWPILKVFIEFGTIFLGFYIFGFWLWVMWDLSSPPRNWVHTTCIRRWSFNHWTAREVFWSPCLKARSPNSNILRSCVLGSSMNFEGLHAIQSITKYNCFQGWTEWWGMPILDLLSVRFSDSRTCFTYDLKNQTFVENCFLSLVGTCVCQRTPSSPNKWHSRQDLLIYDPMSPYFLHHPYS